VPRLDFRKRHAGSLVVTEVAALCWESAGRTDPGKVREVNEDSFLDRCEDRLWLVADGMGGHSAGDVASKTIADLFADIDLSGSLGDLADRVESALLEANARLRQLALSSPTQTTIGATAVVLLARGNYFLVCWVGDSRIYRLRQGRLQQITQDHSQVEELVTRGLLRPEEAENHPASNVVTRAVGATNELFVDMDYGDTRPGDRFLLCSDGLTKELTNLEIRSILDRDASADEMCSALIAMALQRGARDNVTAVVSRVLG
jgi:serine/threonine protein phosphatase PrpC